MDNRFIELLTKQLTNTLTNAERHELNLLLKNNEAFRNQKEIFTDYWKRGNPEYKANTALFRRVLDKIQLEEQQETAADAVKTPFHRRRTYIFLWWSAAAVLIGCAVICFCYINLNKPGKKGTLQAWQQKMTRPREKMAITLADGTMVTLNSGTKFRYPESFTGKNREVYLDGEAFFDVHKDRQHPFIIHTNKMNVRVLGTAFNVKSYHVERVSETTLIRGSIEVTLNDRPSDRIILKPKEKLIVKSNPFSKTGTNISTGVPVTENTDKGTQYTLTNLIYFPNKANNDSAVVETAWMHNKLVFRNQDFGSLAIQMERWYGVKIVFKNEAIEELRFTAVFEKETALQALDALRYTENFHYSVKNSVIYIY